MHIVNLFGAPGAGKSSLAMLVAGFLKTRHPHFTVECPNEITKDIVYEDALKALNCQLYISGKQFWQVARCSGHVDIVVCDSPILLASVYGAFCTPPMPDEWHTVCAYHHYMYPSINYLVTRAHAFETRARAHTEEQSDEIAEAIRRTLIAEGVSYSVVQSSEETAAAIADHVASELTKLKVSKDVDDVSSS